VNDSSTHSNSSSIVLVSGLRSSFTRVVAFIPACLLNEASLSSIELSSPCRAFFGLVAA